MRVTFVASSFVHLSVRLYRTRILEMTRQGAEPVCRIHVYLDLFVLLAHLT